MQRPIPGRGLGAASWLEVEDACQQSVELEAERTSYVDELYDIKPTLAKLVAGDELLMPPSRAAICFWFSSCAFRASTSRMIKARWRSSARPLLFDRSSVAMQGGAIALFSHTDRGTARR